MPGSAYEAYVYVKPQREIAVGFWRGYGLLCLLMMVYSLRRHDADGPMENTAGAGKRGTLQGKVMLLGWVKAAVIQTELIFSYFKHIQKCIIYGKMLLFIKLHTTVFPGRG